MGRVFVKRLSITGKGAKKRLTQAAPSAWLLHFTTIDAMGTQRAIAAQIIEQKGNYVLALKENLGYEQNV